MTGDRGLRGHRAVDHDLGEAGSRVRLRFDPDDGRLASVAWSRISEPGDLAAFRLVERLGPVGALHEVLAGGPETARWRVRLRTTDPARDLATIHRFGGRLVVPGDEEWPAGLADLASTPPHCLWVRGPGRLDALCARAVAVVGARAATAYGEHVAAEMAAGLTERGVTVVSGAAYGVDGAAHRGALAAEGPTMAVLACGLDRWYPTGHRRLIDRIAATGAVVSEVPPGSAPTRWRFLERNRLIAAMTTVTIVVEAAARSGALATAGRALKLARTVAAVPGPVTSPSSTGCNQLLREGAVCVTDVAEVLELLYPIGEQLALPVAAPAADHDGLAVDDLRVYDALPIRSPAPVESLAQVAGLLEDEVAAGLGRLEVRGLAHREGSGWRRSARRPGRSGAGA